jgi:chromosome segregation ATPase
MKVVDFNEELRPLFSSLLSTWFIVDDKRQALQASFDSATKTRRNVVTMDGHLFKADGEILPQRIGSNKNDRGNSAALAKLQSQLNELQLSEESSKREIASLMAQIGAVKREITSLSDEASRAVEQRSVLEDQKEQLDESLHEVNEKIATCKQLNQAKDKFKEISASAPLIKELFEIEREIKEIEDKEDKALQEQREVIKLKAKIEALKKKHAHLTHEISTHEHDNQKVDEESEEIEACSKKIKRQKNVADKEKKLKQDEVEKLNDAITEKKRELNSLVKKAISIEAEIKQVQGNLNSLAEQKKELKTKLADVMDTSAEDNDFDISGEEFKRKIKRVELKIQDLNKRLKEISENNQLDLEAHEKHDKLAQKLRETKKSMEVVQTQAREQQVEISKLEDERYKTFCFFIDKINTSLSDIYHKLTINGDCYLGFTEDKKALFESGVWFQVKPDRNQWRSFNDLSGGQKAVAALALSLAINDVFPSAIYLFDEIDASLDVGAVGRVAKYLQRLSQTNSSQFIVISHRVPFIQV